MPRAEEPSGAPKPLDLDPELAVEPEVIAPLPERARRAPIKALIRVVVGGGVFAALLATTDLSALLEKVADARARYIAGAVALFLLGLAVSALRWREYLMALGIPMGFGSLYRLYFVGTFFNAFLPTGIGGDAYKAIRIGRGRPQGVMRHAFASVFLDRFAGVVGLAVVGLSMSLIQLASGGNRAVPLAGTLISAAILGAAGLLLGPGERLLGKGRLIKLEEGVGGKVRRMVRAVHAAGRNRRAFTLGLALGFTFQLTVLVYHVTLARALRLTEVPVPAMSAIVVIASVAVLIPLSVGGLGFLEYAYVLTLGAYGVDDVTARTFALVARAVLLVSSAMGGLVYLVWGGEVSASEAGVTGDGSFSPSEDSE